MEDDDEFGDLYTDVLLPLTIPSAPPPPPVASAAPSSSRPLDLNVHSDDEEILFGAPRSNSNQSNFNIPQLNPKIKPSSFDLNRELKKEPEEEENSAGIGQASASDLQARVLVKEEERGFEDPNYMNEPEIDVVVDERDDKDDVFLPDKDDNLVGMSENLEVNTEIEDMGLSVEPMNMIPGLSGPRVSDREEGEGDDWDSDSEDDLQIVLNDNNNTGIMGMERTGVVDDDEDEDGDPLVIVADNDPNHQPMEEQDWGEDASQVAEGGERKELGDGASAKVNGAAAVAPKIGYSSHGYHHPFHSQFKYVRPGAAPIPGAAPVAPGGAPGQVRPPVNLVHFAGRGRGDWRPTGIKSALPMQKNFHPGYGMPAWGNNASGRGFGSGLEFTLPSHKTIFEVDIDSFEEKPWRLQGIDISDFFNFGLNEESWKEYCKQLEQLRLEATMQSKIRVYESGRTEQEYDPDLPPELAAAAGIHDVTSENQSLGKADTGQSDVAKGSTRSRMQLPPGRAIQVETGYGERLPSTETRPPRIRDSDSIIEIVLQGSADDDSFPGNDVAEPPDNDLSGENLRRSREVEESNVQEDTVHFDRSPHTYTGRKSELVGRRSPLKNSAHDDITEEDRISHSLSEAPIGDRPDSRSKTSSYTSRKFNSPHSERLTQKRAPDRSPSGSLQDKKFLDNQKEESIESFEGKHSLSSSPVTVGSAEERDLNQNDTVHDEPVPPDGGSGMEQEEMALDVSTTNTLKDENLMHSVKKQKLISLVEQPPTQEIDEGEDSKAARSSDNSKARSGSSRDYRNVRGGIEDEVVQTRRSTRIGIVKRPFGEDERIGRSRGRDERQEMGRQPMAIKGREDSYSHKKWDSNMAHHSRMKTGSLDRRKERDTEGAWQREDEDPHGGRARAEDTRKRERGDEMASRQRSKVRELERSDKDELKNKVLENSSWKGDHDKDMISRHKDRDDSAKARNDSFDDLYSRRRKEDVHIKRDHAEKEESLHVHRESTSRRKRERDDILDQRKRDEQARLRDDDTHSVRYKEEGWLQRERVDRQRERDEWPRLKQSHEEISSKREREEGRGGVRSGRAVEDKAWVNHSRVKEEYKGVDREYQFKDAGREQLNRRDRVDNESLSRHRGREDAYSRGNKLNNDDKRSRQERGSSGTDRSVNIDIHKAQEKKHKDHIRKGKESDGGDHNYLAPSKRSREDHHNHRSERVRGMLEQESEHEISMNRPSSKKQKEDASSDDEQQDSKRGRSKLERWTSHKERDFSVGIKLSASLNGKEIKRYNNRGASLTSKVSDDYSKPEEAIANSVSLAEEKDSVGREIRNDPKPTEDKHLDTVEKLKKRSERFKLPMPSEKEALAIKKIENEPLPSMQTEDRPDSEIKLERPARKRRWTSS